MAAYGIGGLLDGFVQGMRAAKQDQLSQDANTRAQEEHQSRMKDAQMRQQIQQTQIDTAKQANDIIQNSLMQQDPQTGQWSMRPDVTPDDLQAAQQKILPLTVKMAAVAGDAKGMTAVMTDALTRSMVQDQRDALSTYVAAKTDPASAIPQVVGYFNKFQPNNQQIDPSQVTYDPQKGYVSSDGQTIPLGLPLAHTIRTALDPMQAYANMTHIASMTGTESRAQATFDASANQRKLESDRAALQDQNVPAVVGAETQAAILKPQQIQAGIRASNAAANKSDAEATIELPARANYYNANAEYATEGKNASATARADAAKSKADQAIQDRMSRVILPGKADNLSPSQRDLAGTQLGIAAQVYNDPDNQRAGVTPEEAAGIVKTITNPKVLTGDTLNSVQISKDGSTAAVRSNGRFVKVPLSPDQSARLQAALAQKAKLDQRQRRIGGIRNPATDQQ